MSATGSHNDSYAEAIHRQWAANYFLEKKPPAECTGGPTFSLIFARISAHSRSFLLTFAPRLLWQMRITTHRTRTVNLCLRCVGLF